MEHDPTQCSAPGCGSAPSVQYRQTQTSPDGDYTQAYFACPTHAYTDPVQAAGLHAATCTLFPCTCTPYLPPQDPTP